MNTEQLVEQLHNPNVYPHPVDAISTIETHISVVFLTGDYAYKLKKPVDFGFLDFTSLSQRKKYCQLELELNQRTAPLLYLDVIAVCLDPETGLLNLQADINSDLAIDYLVKMRQFDPAALLSNYLVENSISFEMIEKLSAQIAKFHLNAEKVKLDSELGQPEVQLQPMLDNFPTLFKTFEDQITVSQLKQLEAQTDRLFQQLKPILIKRRQQGFVKACHGDLHLENIALIDGGPVLFDGIEFNDRFRWIDVISDLSFLLIDLDIKQQKSAGLKVLSLYLNRTLDYKALNLLSFYRVYRALVRAKINALRAAQFDESSDQGKAVRSKAKSYIDLACGYLETNTSPKCILLQGVSGTGKSYFANQLLIGLPNLNALIISSDRTRKTLYGIESTHRVQEAEKRDLYSEDMNRQTYQTMENNAEAALNAGFNVIIDATFLKHEHRQRFYAIASKNQAESYLISLEADKEFTKQAIQKRQQLNNNPSDADSEIMLRQLKYFEPPMKQENALTLNAQKLRAEFPAKQLQNFLKLPI